MTESTPPALQRLGRRTVLSGAIAAVLAALAARRPVRARRRDGAPDAPAPPERPIWIGHL